MKIKTVNQLVLDKLKHLKDKVLYLVIGMDVDVEVIVFVIKMSHSKIIPQC